MNYRFYSLMMLNALCVTSYAKNTIDPLSKITITSQRATGKKNPEQPKSYTFSYQGNVVTTLADDSTINADKLDIVFDKERISTSNVVTSLTKTIPQDKASNITEVVFKNNVVIKRKSQTINADSATIDPAKRHCILQGNVIVSQQKVRVSDIPIDMKSEKAILSLDTGTLTFVGSAQRPVNTVINLAYHHLNPSKTKKAHKTS